MAYLLALELQGSKLGSGIDRRGRSRGVSGKIQRAVVLVARRRVFGSDAHHS